MERSGRKIHTVDEFSNPTLEVFGHVQRIIVDQLGINRNEITMVSFIVNDLGADSLDIVELIMAVEEEFNIDIPDQQAEKMQTVGDVVHYILR